MKQFLLLVLVLSLLLVGAEHKVTLGQNGCLEMWNVAQENAELKVTSMMGDDDLVYVGANVDLETMIAVYDANSGNITKCNWFEPLGSTVADMVVFQDQIYVAFAGENEEIGLQVFSKEMESVGLNHVGSVYDIEVADDKLYIATDEGVLVSPDWSNFSDLEYEFEKATQAIYFEKDTWLVNFAESEILALFHLGSISFPVFDSVTITDHAVVIFASDPVVLMVGEGNLSGYFPLPGGDPQNSNLSNVSDVFVDGENIYVSTQEGVYQGTLVDLMFSDDLPLQRSSDAFDQVLFYNNKLWAAGANGVVVLQ